MGRVGAVNEIIADTPELIQSYQLIALKGALKLESLGMKGRGKSALSIVKGMGIKAKTAKQALPLFVAMLREKGLLK